MRIRTIATLAILAVALAIPGVSLAGSKSKIKHGIGKGGVPALRDDLQDKITGLDARVVELETQVTELSDRLADIESLFSDADGDGFVSLIEDCDDADGAVSPGAAEVEGNGIDDDCDGETDETP